MPPPPEELTAGPVAGLALRTQPDKRLVTLVREGYEVAFEEIVRRYGKALGRYAAAIVGGRSEDVTQDAFSKALLALRRDDSEIELRPWLYRIVRNTALNDLRDRPPASVVLTETIAAAHDAAEEVERREETADLMKRLRSLPEPQRAAIVMRELEGLSHDEIAAALGVSGGAARQAIFRARQALRGGLGMLVPLPLMKLLIDHGAEAVGAGAGGAAIAGGVASAGGVGAGGALKVGLATALAVGAVGTGVVVEQNRDKGNGANQTGGASATQLSGDGADAPSPSSPPGLAGGIATGEDRGEGKQPSDDRHGPSRGEDPALDSEGGDGAPGRKHGEGRSDGHRSGHGPAQGHTPGGRPPRHGPSGRGGDHGGPGQGGPQGPGGRSGGGSGLGGQGEGGRSGHSGPPTQGGGGRGGLGGSGGAHGGPVDGSGETGGGSGEEPPTVEAEPNPPDSPEEPGDSREDTGQSQSSGSDSEDS